MPKRIIQVTKFPKYMVVTPTIEEPAFPNAGDIKSFIEGQKADYLAAIKHIETNILGQSPPETWTPAKVLEILNTIHTITAKTLITHPCGKASIGNCKPGQYRTMHVHALKSTPKPKDDNSPEYPQYNSDYPETIFSILLDAYGSLELATNFIKWYTKFGVGFKRIDEIDKRLEEAIEQQRLFLERQKSSRKIANKNEWRKIYFDNLSLREWTNRFFEGTGKAFFVKKMTPDEFWARATMPGLYTEAERHAGNLIFKFFLPPNKIQSAMEAFSIRLIDMLKNENADPIQIAAFAHTELTHNIHCYADGNGRTIRFFTNIILMSYGYLPYHFDSNQKEKVEYYRTIEAIDLEPKGLEKLLLENIQAKTASSLCTAAQAGDISKIRNFIKMRADVNAAGPQGWRPLHFACKMKKNEAAKFLVGNGARTDCTNEKNKTPLELCTSNEKELVDSLKIIEAQAKLDEPFHQFLNSTEVLPILTQFKSTIINYDQSKNILSIILEHYQESHIERIPPLHSS